MADGTAVRGRGDGRTAVRRDPVPRLVEPDPRRRPGRPTPARTSTIHANRGVAGIDGNVSTAVGMALAGDGPAYALIGDLTLLHDLNGLLIGPPEQRPDLTLVVHNDDGGGIFTLLEQGAAEYQNSFERVFGTPHGAELRPCVAVTAWRTSGRRQCDELRAALQPGRGLKVVEVRSDRALLRDLHARLRAAVTEAACASTPGSRRSRRARPVVLVAKAFVQVDGVVELPPEIVELPQGKLGQVGRVEMIGRGRRLRSWSSWHRLHRVPGVLHQLPPFERAYHGISPVWQTSSNRVNRVSCSAGNRPLWTHGQQQSGFGAPA